MVANNLKVPVADVMTHQPHSLSPMDQLDRADELCRTYHIHHLPVVDIYGKVVGIVSQSDLLKVSYGFSLFRKQDSELYNRTLYKTLLVRDVMTRDVTCLQVSDPIIYALRIFEQNHFHAIPVLEDDQLAGIITPMDLLRISFPKTY
ncbi:MAG: CBS domain-containing protein [Saprospiraceae bacterium]|nr:CBS domain-containing protein [Lewinella sp.]